MPMIDDKILMMLEKKVHPIEHRKKESQDRKVEDEVFDHQTLLTIYKLICDGNLGTIDYPIATGKEGNVFKGTGPQGDVAIKIYRVEPYLQEHREIHTG